MTPDELHDLVQRDPVAAWPHIAAHIDQARRDDRDLVLLEDLEFMRRKGKPGTPGPRVSYWA